jgi:hypothetical protein
MTRITSYLLADHRRLEQLLASASEGPCFDAKAFAAFREGLLRHIAIEEKLLLRAARDAQNGVPLERARRLRIEHGAIASLLVPTPDRALCEELTILLRAHDALEEGSGGVYEECERLFSEAQSSALAEQAEAFGAIPVAQHFDGPRALRSASEALLRSAGAVTPTTPPTTPPTTQRGRP